MASSRYVKVLELKVEKKSVARLLGEPIVLLRIVVGMLGCKRLILVELIYEEKRKMRDDEKCEIFNKRMCDVYRIRLNPLECRVV